MVRDDFHKHNDFSRTQLFGVLTGLLLILSGCGEDPAIVGEARKLDEVIASSEWDAFVQVVDLLPEPRLKELPDHRPPLPQWQSERTLPVEELAAEERKSLLAAWEPAKLARELSRNRVIVKKLQQAQMSVDQFVGMALSVGAAMQRAQLPEQFAFDDLIRRGDEVIHDLTQDHRLFASLSLEDRHRVLDEAVWLHRVDRARRLQTIPTENVALVKQHGEWLKKTMPAAFLAHPFDKVADLLEEQGLPFVELPESGNDAAIEWSPADAIVGR